MSAPVLSRHSSEIGTNADAPETASTPRRRQAIVSLRLVISVVAALVVAFVAACTLSITSVTSLAALRDVGKSHASALLGTVEEQTLGLFEPQIRNIEVMQNLSRSRDWAWPSDDPASFTFWEDAARYGWLSTRLRDAGVILYFWDNSRISYSPWNRTHSLLSTVKATPASAPGGLANQTFVSNRTAVDMTGAGRHVALGALTGDGYRTVGTSWESTMRTLTAGGRSPSIAGYLVRSSSDSRGSTVEKYVAMAMPLYRQRDAANPSSANLYGIALTALFIDDISNFLANTRATPNTEAFALDSRGFLLGSSMAQSFLTETVIAPGAQATRPGCSASDAAGAVSTGPNSEVCRASRLSYGYAPLAALPNSVIDAPTPAVMLFASDTDGYFFVAYATVPLRLPGMTISLVLLMPETDVIGDVVQSRNIAIGIVAALVLVAGAVNFGVIFVLLSPLEAIALRMRKAANLEDDGADEEVSAMSEVAELQQAYYAMNDELNRIRSFVPQSVLMAYKSGGGDNDTDGGVPDEDEDEGDLDMDLSASNLQRGASQRASRRESNAFGALKRRSCGDSGNHAPESRRGSLMPGHSTVTVGSAGNQSCATFKKKNSASAFGRPVVNLKPVTLTVLVANLCGFNQLVAAVTKDVAVAQITDTVDFVFRTVARHGGVLASYHGDHFVATFNAVKSCGSHALAAVRVGVELRDGADGVGFGSALRVGVATGRCQVGNLGNKEIKAFSTVGPAYQHACVLERMGRLYGEADERSVLATRRTCTDVGSYFRYRFVDIVPLPGRERGAGATVTAIATIVRAVDAAQEKKAADDGNDDEWLYLVGNTAKNDPNSDWNEAFTAVIGGKVARATTLLETYEAQFPAQQPSSPLMFDDTGAISGATAAADGSDESLPSAAVQQPSGRSKSITVANPRTASAFDAPAAANGPPPVASSVPLLAPHAHRETLRALLARDREDMFADLGRYYMSGFDV